MSTGKYPHQTNHSVAKSASVIGLATFISRLLGFLRDVVIARLFGVYVYAQAFVIAFRIPNLFRDLVGEGATNAAFVPVFSEYTVRHTKEEFWELANVVLNLLLVMLMSLTILGIAFSPVIVRMIAPGFIASPEKLAATIKLNRIIFPYILLISLSAYSMGLLNSLKNFAVSAYFTDMQRRRENTFYSKSEEDARSFVDAAYALRQARFPGNIGLLLTVEFFLSHPIQDPMGLRSSLKKKDNSFELRVMFMSFLLIPVGISGDFQRRLPKSRVCFWTAEAVGLVVR